MKKLIAFTLLFSVMLGSYWNLTTLPTSATTLQAKDDQTGDCIRKGKCKD